MSAKNNNQIDVPQAREAGSVGGQLVKKICPIRNMKFERHIRTAMGHTQAVQYIATITI